MTPTATSIRTALAGLAHNLAAGARLALFRPAAGFRIDLVQWLLVVFTSALLDVALDGLRAAPGASFTLTGLTGELYSVGLLMVSSAIIALASRDDGMFIGVPVVVLAAFPLLQIVHAAPSMVGVDMGPAAALAFEVLLSAWMIALCMRSVYVVGTVPQQRPLLRAFAGGLLLSLPLWWAPFAGPLTGWFDSNDDEAATDASLSPVSEPVLAAQAHLLDHALDELDDSREGVADLYFVGFAPDSRQDGFRQSVDNARNVLDERFGTNGRSIVLVNHGDTVAELPFATLTNLHRVLQEIGEAIDPDDDVVMLYLTAGPVAGNHGLAAVLPPLELVPVTPESLKQLLDNAGIRYRVVVVETCAAGAWLDALRDDDTAVLVSSPGEQDAQGCAGGPDPSPFSAALFDRALRASESIPAALGEAAREGRGDAAARLAIGRHIETQLARVRSGPALRSARLDRHRRDAGRLTRVGLASTISRFR